MKRTHTFTFAFALCAALGLSGLVGCACSTSASSDDTATSTAVVSDATVSGTASSTTGSTDAGAQDDATFIQNDTQSKLASLFDAGRLAESMRSIDEMRTMEEAGFDIDAYAKAITGIVNFKVSDVEVREDTATATVDITIPDMGEAGVKLLNEEADRQFAELSDEQRDALTADEGMIIQMKAMTTAFSNPDFPTATQTLLIDYVKSDDGWAMQDPGMVENTVSAILGA